MINLLPPESTHQLRAARHNNILLLFIIGGGVTIGLIVLVYGVTFALMKSTELSNSASSEESKLRIAKFNQVEAQAKEYANNLKLAKTIFDSELSYTTALRKVSSALPAGTVLQSLDLSPTTTSQPITISILAKTPANALQVKESFEKAGIAKDITIASISSGTDASGTQSADAPPSDYPVSLNLNLAFDKSIFTEEKQDE